MKQKNTESKTKRPRRITFVTALQSLYLTGTFYLTNNLFSYASACAFGFLFSFIPIVMMILVILIRFLHASPETVTAMLSQSRIFSDAFDLNYLINSVLSIKKITNFEIVLGLAIIWMARRFFSSVLTGLQSIFKQASPSRPVFSQILIFAGEAVLVIAAASIMFIVISFKTVRRSTLFSSLVLKFPGLLGNFASFWVTILPLIGIFFMVLICYKSESGTKPSWFICIIAAFACTFSFWVFQRLMGLFINVNRYNLIYGVLSNVIVILLEVYFFFMMFLFFAQFIFVFQFFDELLLGELYVLPDRDDTHILSSIKRMLFIRPDYLLHKDVNVIHRKKGDFIYHQDDVDSDTYYIARGTVQIVRKNNISFLERGKFFGEEACVLSESRNEDAKAYTDVEIVRISGETFLSLLEKNPDASRKALSQISTYFAKVYGRKDEFRL